MNEFLPILENKIIFNNHKNLPNSLRCLIVGSSRCGEKLLAFEDTPYSQLFRFWNFIIFTKSSFQPKYQLLSQGLNAGVQKEEIIGIFKLQNKPHNYNIEDIIQLFFDAQKCKKKSKLQVVFLW